MTEDGRRQKTEEEGGNRGAGETGTRAEDRGPMTDDGWRGKARGRKGGKMTDDGRGSGELGEGGYGCQIQALILNKTG
ncbi:MAG: hypothetical protein SWQ30_13945 [Thermodesulfobacteriota bacterium]|nr:hypothetical protein [Thermodesulfobacteriota bacterium]